MAGGRKMSLLPCVRSHGYNLQMIVLSFAQMELLVPPTHAVLYAPQGRWESHANRDTVTARDTYCLVRRAVSIQCCQDVSC